MSDKKVTSKEVMEVLNSYLFSKKQKQSYYKQLAKALTNRIVPFICELIKNADLEPDEVRTIQDATNEKFDAIKVAYKEQLEREIAEKQEELKKLELE